MDKLITTDIGGFPFVLDDLRFAQGGVEDALTGILSRYSDGSEGQSFLLSGGTVVVNGPNLDVTAGYAAFKGEVVKIDAHSVVDAGIFKVHFWKLVTDFVSGAPSEKIFENGNGFSTYQTRRLQLTHEDIDSIPGDPMIFSRTSLTSTTFLDYVADPANIITNAVAIATNTSSILANFNATEAIKAQWDVINLAGSATVVANDRSDGLGTERALQTAPIAGSFLRYKIVGKTVHFNFKLIEAEFEPFDTFNNASLIIKSLPFAGKAGVAEQFGTYYAEAEAGDLISGSQPFFFSSGAQIVMSLVAVEESHASFNRAYTWASTTSISLAGSSSGVARKYDVAGGGTFEIA